MGSEGIILRDARRGAAAGIETFLARSVRGLEWLAAAEIETDLGGKIVEVGHREILQQNAAIGMGIGAHTSIALGSEFCQFRNQLARAIEEFLGSIAFQPFFELLEMFWM